MLTIMNLSLNPILCFFFFSIISCCIPRNQANLRKNNLGLDIVLDQIPKAAHQHPQIALSLSVYCNPKNIESLMHESYIWKGCSMPCTKHKNYQSKLNLYPVAPLPATHLSTTFVYVLRFYTCILSLTIHSKFNEHLSKAKDCHFGHGNWYQSLVSLAFLSLLVTLSHLHFPSF